MAILNDTVSMCKNWSDGEFKFNDITGAIAVGTDLLSAALDPVGALIAAPLGELLEFMVHHIKFISEPLAKLEGSDELVAQQANKWREVGKDFVAAGNLHAQGVNDMSSWQGDASKAYHTFMKAINEVFAQVDKAAQGMALGVEMAGALVGVIRGFIWDLITDLLTKAIEGAIAALAAAVPTFGSSLAAFAGWYTLHVGRIGMKIFKFIEKLLAKAEKFASRCKLISKRIKKAKERCANICKQLKNAEFNRGRTVSSKTRIPRSKRSTEVPKGSLPGDTTAHHKSGVKPNVGTRKNPWSVGPDGSYTDIVKDDVKKLPKKFVDAAKKKGPKIAMDAWEAMQRERVTRIE